jgi:hypothetical protein
MTSFLTSLSLARSIEDDSKIFHNMTVGTAKLFFFVALYCLLFDICTCCLALSSQIQVRLPDNNLELGWLNFWDLQHNLAVINIPRFHTLQVACLDNQRQFESHSKVVAVGRCFNSGKLMATAGMLTANPSGDYRAVSTCQITMVCPLFISLFSFRT